MSDEIRKVSCIVCPMGCAGTVALQDGAVVSTAGFTCERGKAYAKEEVAAPKRTLTTTVRVKGGVLPLVPVISTRPLPKEQLLRAARCLAQAQAAAPIAEGQVIVSDLLNLGVDIVATRAIAVAAEIERKGGIINQGRDNNM